MNIINFNIAVQFKLIALHYGTWQLMYNYLYNNNN